MKNREVVVWLLYHGANPDRPERERCTMNHDLIKHDNELWELFTRNEEYRPHQVDRYGRFAPSHTREEESADPKVSTYLFEHGLEITYPDDKPFAVCLTHDVDEIYPPVHHAILSSLHCVKALDLQKLNSFVFWKFTGTRESPYRNFQDIMKLEETYQAKSSFYFLATGRDIRRFRYDIEDIGTELGMILDNGCEVGLHGSFHAFDNVQEIRREKERLETIINRKIIGYRNHYLRFKLPDTWEILASLNFKYDTTLGFHDRVGFRNGMCHPFKPFNLCSNEEIDIVEIPLVIMDTAIFEHYPLPRIWPTVKGLIDCTKQCGGVVTILWHNEGFSCPFKEMWLRMYEKILAYCHKEDALMTSAEEIWKIYAAQLTG